MSDLIRVALVAEGRTDKGVIEAAIESVLGARSFVLTQLQPEESLPFNQLRGGWGGVYHWCRQAALRAGGVLTNDPLFVTFDLLILHLDADVAEKQYGDAGIEPTLNNLPCVQNCPPPELTTNQLRAVLLGWAGQAHLPPRTVLCTPSKSTEAWVLSALYPLDPVVISGNLECYPTPALQLQSKKKKGRLVSGGKKIVEMYHQRRSEITAAWPQVRDCCTEAHRFTSDLEV